MLWKDHLCTNLLSWKRFFLLPEIHNINLSFILKFINPSFLTLILPKPNKVISILTETHINHDQIHHTRNNWLGPIFFSPGDSNTKKKLFYFIWVLKVTLSLTLIQKGGLFPLRLLPLMIEFCLFPFRVQHQRTAG